VRDGGGIFKNLRIPLLSPAEMERMPFMEYGIEGQYIFSYRHAMLRQMTRDDLMHHVGTTYNTIWSVGCPHSCKFCSQAAFIGLDRDYALYRGPSPDYIIREVLEVQQNFPLDYVIFYDSNFLGRSLAELTEFSQLFKKTGLSFILSGTNPASINEEKIAVLLDGGLVRIKMGFESASEDILRLFNRPVNVDQLRRATLVLGRFGGKMVAPAFEMIVDNPYETQKQLYQTIDFLEKTPAPFTISLFSLQFMPGTALSSEITDFSLVEEHMDKEYMFSYRPTAINNLISLFAILKPPVLLTKLIRRLVQGREERLYPGLKTFLFRLMLLRRGMNQVRFGDYSTFPWQFMALYHRYRLFKTKLPWVKHA
jgi:radical SAM superfamily enzyme YgiQ (UPF0313 family)